MINDYLPKDMTFDSSRNKGWYLGNDGMLYNETLKDTTLKAGEKKELKLVLTKQMNSDNTGTVSNKVLLATTLNKNGLQDNVDDNVATQEVLILIKTGYTAQITIIMAIIILAIVLFILNVRAEYNENKNNIT